MLTVTGRRRGFYFVFDRMAAIGVLLVAAGLRWVRPGLVEFKYDEAHIFGMAQEIAAGGYWPALSGGTSIGVQRSALDAYLLAIPLALTGNSPEAAVLWLGMLGVLAVAMTYLLGRLIGGRMTGLLAALYMAANPWLAFYDRKFWAHIQVVFSVLLLLLAWQAVVADRKRARFWFPVVAALQLLTHVLALVQALSWLGAFLAAPRRWLRRETLWGALAGLALLTPYLWALGKRLAAVGAGAAWQAGRSAAGGGGEGATQALAGRLGLLWQLVGGDRIFELTGTGQRLTGWDQMLWWGRWLALILIAAGLLRVLLWLRDERRRPGAVLLLAWGVGPLLALSFGPLTAYLQYWTVLLPLPALFFALALSWPLAATRPRWRRLHAVKPLLILLLASALLVVWGGAWGGVLARIDAGAGRQTFGRPLLEWQEAAEAANAWATKLELEQVKVLAQGVDPGQDGEPAAIAALIGNPPYARFLYLTGETPALLLHARQPSLYLTTTSAMRPALEALGREVWTGRGEDPMRLYLLPAAPDADLPVTSLPEPRLFDVGLALTGYSFQEPWPAGQTVLATLVWRVTTPSDQARQRDFTAFNHIVRAGTDEKVVQVDGLALLSRDWWPDDVLYQGYWVTIPEAGSFEWLAGLYSRADGGRAQLLSGGDSVSLPLTGER
jgi:hypothetical protein